jgi:putative transcriptional regulator
VSHTLRSARTRIISVRLAEHSNDGSIMRKAAKAKIDGAKAKIDWSAVDAMAGEQRHAAAMADPEARPLTEEHIAMGRARLVPRVRTLRRALKLSQEKFAARYHIPVGTLRDWEQGRKEPDAAAKAYLHVIASEPELVRKALAKRHHGAQEDEAA